ncbi:hypothetical protein LTR64_007817 [Lithohypha guttulata]|uniref:uncharacterized protein n=1 Tax=Lithohypha guttulata TaxID=1690604 RepID=UPI002DDEB5F0|nr:hypothetical protein LTR51_007329 [Lithohypha guttulata]
MATLESLPNEMLEIVCNHLSSEVSQDSRACKALYSLSLTSKRLHSTAQPHLYNHIDTGTCNLVSLVQTLCLRPDLAALIKIVHLRSTRGYIVTEELVEFLRLHVKHAFTEDYCAELKKILTYPPRLRMEKERFHSILLLYLPKVEEIIFYTNENQFADWYARPHLYGQWPYGATVMPCLKNLHEVVARRASIVKSGRLQAIIEASAVESYTTSSPGAFRTFCPRFELPLKHLDITCGHLDFEGTKPVFLLNCGKLERLSITCTYFCPLWFRTRQMQRLVDAICETNSVKKLQYLHLNMRDDGRESQTDLRHKVNVDFRPERFLSLKSMGVNMWLIEERRSYLTKLPQTIEDLNVYGSSAKTSVYKEKYIDQMFQDAESIALQYPNLQTIQYWDDTIKGNRLMRQMDLK